MTSMCVAGALIGARYIIKEKIGEGGMQSVFSARDTILGRDVALKTPINNSANKRFHSSAILSAKINHPHVAKTLDYFEDRNVPFLIEELIIGTDLSTSFLQKMTRVDPFLVAKIFHRLAKGLSASHHEGVVHRDLKPTNIMVGTEMSIETVKITDFGIAKMAQSEMLAAELENSTVVNSTVMGAIPYMAPEAITNPARVEKSADVWSLGAIVFELLTGQKPFGAGLGAIRNICAGNPPVFPDFIFSNPQFAPLANHIKEILLSCFATNPEDRPTADELVIKCGELCYPITDRHTGVIKNIQYNIRGFIATLEEDVFFHFDSVYGEKVVQGDTVVFSKSIGNGAWRAYPVVKLRTN